LLDTMGGILVTELRPENPLVALRRPPN
jgi:hypothetical protein